MGERRLVDKEVTRIQHPTMSWIRLLCGYETIKNCEDF